MTTQAEVRSLHSLEYGDWSGYYLGKEHSGNSTTSEEVSGDRPGHYEAQTTYTGVDYEYCGRLHVKVAQEEETLRREDKSCEWCITTIPVSIPPPPSYHDVTDYFHSSSITSVTASTNPRPHLTSSYLPSSILHLPRIAAFIPLSLPLSLLTHPSPPPSFPSLYFFFLSFPSSPPATPHYFLFFYLSLPPIPFSAFTNLIFASFPLQLHSHKGRGEEHVE